VWLQKRIAEEIERGDVGTADALVEQSLTFYLDYEEGEVGHDEFRKTKAVIDEALEHGRRGEGRPAEEVFAAMRAEYGLLR
jgi:hypothetical protein